MGPTPCSLTPEGRPTASGEKSHQTGEFLLLPHPYSHLPLLSWFSAATTMTGGIPASSQSPSTGLLQACLQSQEALPVSQAFWRPQSGFKQPNLGIPGSAYPAMSTSRATAPPCGYCELRKKGPGEGWGFPAVQFGSQVLLVLKQS